jgi:signal transduction histidine kinase
MKDEVRQRCLEPFFTTKGEEGSGLGLAMVYGIIQRHGGTLEIHTAVDQGTKFRIRLPCWLKVQDVPFLQNDRSAATTTAPRLLTVSS